MSLKPSFKTKRETEVGKQIYFPLKLANEISVTTSGHGEKRNLTVEGNKVHL